MEVAASPVAPVLGLALVRTASPVQCSGFAEPTLQFLARSARSRLDAAGRLSLLRMCRWSRQWARLSSTRATFVVTNHLRETIHVDRCGEHVQAGLDRRVGARSENEMAAFCVLSHYAGPLALAPGESVTDSLQVRSAGAFRLFVGYGRGDQRILYQARSGAFRVD